MSKRKPTRKPPQPPEPKNQPAQAVGEADSQAPLVFTRRQMIGGLLLVAVIAVGALAVLLSSSQNADVSNEGYATPLPYVIGSVENCVGNSDFVQRVGFDVAHSALDTRAKYVKGVALRELNANGNITNTYQDPSWTSAGYMGPFQRDAKGNIYLIPIPFINILDNPPEKSNIIYRIDDTTGVMSPLTDLPSDAPVTPENVYGLLGITYDCDTNSLYASSVFGSTYDHVAGSIFQIDPDSGAVKSTLPGVDAFGIGVFNGINSKRLYFGMARTSDIYSVGLDKNGGFTDDIRPEFSLVGLGTHEDEHAQSIDFQGRTVLVVKITQFDFNLVAPTETQQTVLTYNYNANEDQWHLVSSEVVNE